MQALALLTRADTVATFHCRYAGALSAKPTRLFGTLRGLHSMGFQGWPKFSKGFLYQGPLPPSCGHKHEPLIGTKPDGTWRTAEAAAYPQGLCSDIAALIVDTFLNRHRTLYRGGQLATTAAVASSSSSGASPAPPAAPSSSAASASSSTTPTRACLADIATWGPEDVYIRRKDKKRSLRHSAWANPFRIGQQGRTRRQALDAYEKHLWEDEGLRARLGELSGKRLVCACRAYEDCHADVIIAFFGEMTSGAVDETRESRLGPRRPALMEEATSDEDEDGVTRPKLGEGLLGRGPPLRTTNFGKERFFHDGAGLCSPGRWPPEARALEVEGPSKRLRVELLKILVSLPYQMILAKLAANKFDQCPFGEEVVAKGRKIWADILQEFSGKRPGVAPEPGQCMLLECLGLHLKLAGDPDWRIMSESSWSFAKGTPIGIGVKMPRVPAVFERKVRWRRYDEGVRRGRAGLERELRLGRKPPWGDPAAVQGGGEAGPHEGGSRGGGAGQIRGAADGSSNWRLREGHGLLPHHSRCHPWRPRQPADQAERPGQGPRNCRSQDPVEAGKVEGRHGLLLKG